MIDLEDLNQHIASRAELEWPLTVFAGAGVSIDAGLPTWERLIGGVIEDLGTHLIAAPDPPGRRESLQRDLSRQLKAVAEAVKWLGPTWFDSIEERAQLASVLALRLARTQTSNGKLPNLLAVRNQLLRDAVGAVIGGAAVPGPLASSLGAKLVAGGSLKLVVTTNWDDLIERALNAPVALPAPVPGNPYIAKQIPEDPKPVVHLHGVLDAGSGGWPATEPLVFSRSDFLEFTRPATAEPRWQDELVSLCFRESTCLFVGTSMSDLNYQRWIYERSTRSYATRGRPVEQIAARPDPQCVILFHARRFAGPHGDELKQAVANRWAEWRARTMFLETQEIVTLIDGLP